LLGETKSARDELVEHDGFQVLGFRDGLWKYISPELLAAPGPRRGPKAQLYDLGTDLGESNNLASGQAEKIKELSKSLQKARQP
jgi:hypothetical protein